MFNSPAAKAASPCVRDKRWRFSCGATLLLALSLASAATVAQSSTAGGLSLYSHAIQQTSPVKRMREMQQFLSSAPDSSLRLDALEVLVWDAVQMHDSAARRRWSSELLSVSPANPLGRAAIA